MGQLRYSQTILNAAYYLLVCCVLGVRPLLIVGLIKLVGSLALACLLGFVIVHSADICGMIAACLRTLPVSHFPFSIDRRWAERSSLAVAPPHQPNRSPLFQRPPPVFCV
ncbi:MAG: hypothetical protein WAK29_17125 [Terriglobales bacterium]